jgi:tryptophan synthase beta chain
MQAYADYFEGKLEDHHFTDAELTANLAEIEALQPVG